MELPIIKGKFQLDGVEDAINNTNELIEKLKEAQTLADNLSNKVSSLEFKAFVNETQADPES